MRKARIFVHGILAGILEELDFKHYRLMYISGYHGPPVSLTMPTIQSTYEFDRFPPFFEGLLPEGPMLTGLLRHYKLDRDDYFGQVLKIGQDVVGAVTIEEME